MEIADDYARLQNSEFIFFTHKCGHKGAFTAYHDWDKFPCNCPWGGLLKNQTVVCPYHTYVSEKKAELEGQLCAVCKE